MRDSIGAIHEAAEVDVIDKGEGERQAPPIGMDRLMVEPATIEPPTEQPGPSSTEQPSTQLPSTEPAPTQPPSAEPPNTKHVATAPPMSELPTTEVPTPPPRIEDMEAIFERLGVIAIPDLNFDLAVNDTDEDEKISECTAVAAPLEEKPTISDTDHAYEPYPSEKKDLATLTLTPVESDTATLPTLPTLSGHPTSISDCESASLSKPPLSTWRSLVLGGVMMLSVFLSTLSSQSVIVTVPRLATSLHINAVQAQWVASSYTLAYGCALLPAGRLSDVFGRRLPFLLGLTFSTIFNAASGPVRSLIPLCILRALSGLGLAIATPAAFGIIGVNFRGPARTTAYACMSLGNPVGAALAMLLGGIMAQRDAFDLFYVLAGISALPLVLGWVIPPDVGTDADRRIDVVGSVGIMAAMGLLTFSLAQSAVAGWRSYVPGTLVASVLLILAFGWWEYRLESRGGRPIVKLSMLAAQRGKMALVALCGFLCFVAVSGWVLLVSLYYQDIRGLSPFNSAVHTLPASVVGVFAAGAVLLLVPRFPASWIIATGGLASGFSCFLYVVKPDRLSYWAIEFVSAVLLPFGADFTVGTGSILMSNLARDEDQSTAGGVFQTAVQLGNAIGVCCASLLAEGKPGMAGLKDAFGFCAAFPWAVAVIAVLGFRGMGRAGDVQHS